MKKIIINGNKPLNGEVTISGAKNSTVALIPASILADSMVTLEGIPNIQDVRSLIEILEEFNVAVTFDAEAGIMNIDPSNMISIPMPTGKIKNLRASYYFMGAILSKFGEGVIGLPGGCNLGPRPIDQHIKGFEALGATIRNEMGAIYLTSPEEGLVGERIYLDVVSIGATINTILAAVRANGQTVIENAAKEPEIIDVCTLLNNMGAKIRGAGTDVIRIDGVDALHGCRHTVIPDRIEAGTYLAAAAVMGEEVLVKNVIVEHLEGFVAKMDEMGVNMEIGEDSILIRKSDDLKMVHIKALPYPGFATDLQQPITPLLLKAAGDGTIIDTIYPKRVNHIAELRRMGAGIKVESDTIFMQGPNTLSGSEVKASDLRAGACLVIAGLMATGTTTITGVENILRGYDGIVEKLTALGAYISMVEDEK